MLTKTAKWKLLLKRADVVDMERGESGSYDKVKRVHREPKKESRTREGERVFKEHRDGVMRPEGLVAEKARAAVNGVDKKLALGVGAALSGLAYLGVKGSKNNQRAIEAEKALRKTKLGLAGAGVLAAAGLGAHEIHKHHEKKSSLTEYAQGALDGIKDVVKSKRRQEAGKRILHDAKVIGVGAVGGAGAGAYMEHKRHEKKASETFRELLDSGLSASEAVKLIKQAEGVGSAAVDAASGLWDDTKNMAQGVGKALTKGIKKHPLAYLGSTAATAGLGGMALAHNSNNGN